MIVQLGNKEFELGHITHNTSTNTWKFDYAGSYITYDTLTKWSQDTRYCQVNRTLTTGWSTFLTSNDTITTWYTYPLYDRLLSGANRTVYLVFYKVPESPTQLNQYPVGAWCVGTGYINSYNQFEFWNTVFSLAGQTLGYYCFISPGDVGVGFYEIYEAPYGRYAGSTISTATARASISSGIWTPNRHQYSANDTMYLETNTPLDKCLFGSVNKGIFGSDANEILPPTGVEVDVTDDPNSETGGLDGTFDPYGDNIDYPDLPTVSGISTGLVTMYRPSVTELTSFAHWLYQTPLDDTIIDTLQKLNTDIFSYIIALNFLPLSTASVDASTFKLGPVDSQIVTNKVLYQYIATTETTIKIDEYYGGFQDYSPLTKVMLYLPFIGFVDLSTDDIMSSTIGLKFHIDLLTGDIVAFVKVYGNYTQSTLYTYNGNCASQIPLNGRDYSQIISNVIQGGVNAGMQALTGNSAGAVAGVINTVIDVATSKPVVKRSGSIVGNAGFLNTYTPYLVIVRPASSHPESYEKFNGRPSNITATLGTLTGYTEIDTMISDGFGNATEEEVNEINRLLKEGVYL